MQIGLQTFTVRKLLRTPQALDQAFAKLANMGLQHLELAVDYLAFPFTPSTAKMIRTTADKHGLHVRSCQIKQATWSKDIAATAQFMHELGANILVNSTVDLKALHKHFASYCAALNVYHEQLKAQGITLAHHNHHYEFLRVDKQSALHYMAEHTNITFALDTYWCAKGGANVLTLLNELQSRVPVMHLRDFSLTRLGLVTGGKDCEIGRGNIPFPQIIQAAQRAGVQYGMIEQKTKTPLESMTISLKNL